MICVNCGQGHDPARIHHTVIQGQRYGYATCRSCTYTTISVVSAGAPAER